MRDVVETACGHAMCKSCVDSMIQSKKACPECEATLQSDGVRKSGFANRMIRKLPVRCPRQTDGEESCAWTGTLDQLANHAASCNMQVLRCSYAGIGCNFSGTVAEMEEHVREAVAKHLHLAGPHLAALPERSREVVALREELKKTREQLGKLLEERKQTVSETRHSVAFPLDIRSQYYYAVHAESKRVYFASPVYWFSMKEPLEELNRGTDNYFAICSMEDGSLISRFESPNSSRYGGNLRAGHADHGPLRFHTRLFAFNEELWFFYQEKIPAAKPNTTTTRVCADIFTLDGTYKEMIIIPNVVALDAFLRVGERIFLQGWADQGKKERVLCSVQAKGHTISPVSTHGLDKHVLVAANNEVLWFHTGKGGGCWVKKDLASGQVSTEFYSRSRPSESVIIPPYIQIPGVCYVNTTNGSLNDHVEPPHEIQYKFSGSNLSWYTYS